MTQAEQIADRIGRKVIADAVGVGLTSVSNAVVRGKFPASWTLIVRQLCASEGVDCPDGAFGFKSINTQYVDEKDIVNKKETISQAD